MYCHSIQSESKKDTMHGFKMFGPLGQLLLRLGPKPEFFRDKFITRQQGVVALSGLSGAFFHEYSCPLVYFLKDIVDHRKKTKLFQSLFVRSHLDHHYLRVFLSV